MSELLPKETDLIVDALCYYRHESDEKVAREIDELLDKLIPATTHDGGGK